jgi:hypothetical protein
MRNILLNFVKEILLDNANRKMLLLANKGRNKFEGWFKFELTKKILAREGINEVSVERKYITNVDGENDEKTVYSDLAFTDGRNQYLVELKTANTSYALDGCNVSTRPITDNINSIINDIKKLYNARIEGNKDVTPIGLSVFVCFPLPEGGHTKLNSDPNSFHIYKILSKCKQDDRQKAILELINFTEEDFIFSMLIGVLPISNNRKPKG